MKEETGLVLSDLLLSEEEELVGGEDVAGLVDTVEGSGRIPPMSILTTQSRAHSEHGFPPGTWAIGGENSRPVTLKPGDNVPFVAVAIRHLRLRRVPIGEENQGRTLCAGFLKDNVFQAITQGGVTSASGKGLCARVETDFTGTGKKRKKVEKIIGFRLPEDAEPTNQCAKCLYGPGRNPSARTADRGFLPRDYKATDENGIVLDLDVPEALRAPDKSDCSLIYRAIGFALCAPYEGAPASWEPTVVSFQMMGYKAGKSLDHLLRGWVRGKKAPWSYITLLGQSSQQNAAGQGYYRPEFLGPYKHPTTGNVVPSPGPKAETAGQFNVQQAAHDLAESLTDSDWIGFFEEDIEASPAAEDADEMTGATSEEVPY